MCSRHEEGGPPHRHGPVVLFDGVCHLCNGLVVFVIQRDPKAEFRFASIQSDTAQALLRSMGVPAESMPDSIVLLESGRLHVRSSAALRIAEHLRFPWPLLKALWFVPRPLRDIVYDFVARRRYRWFGARDVCMVPAAELRTRFLT